MSVTIRTICAIGIACSLPAAPVMAAPTAPSYSCSSEVLPGTSFIGSLSAVRGTVVVSGVGNATQGTPLRVGSQVITGPDGTARLVVTSCTHDLEPNSEAVISKVGSKVQITVKTIFTTQTYGLPTIDPIVSSPVIAPPQPVVIAPIQPPVFPPIVKVIIPVAIIGGVVAASTLGGGDNQASP